MTPKVEINPKLKVFPKLYVGLKVQWDYDHETKVRTPRVHLGFATPLESNAAFEKRKRTVDNWALPYAEWDPVARKNVAKKPLDAITIDNVPLAGFKVTDDVRRVYWGGGNVVWRVEDPRGFELEISSQNLMAIIQQVGVNPGGEIPGKCVWARDGASNILLHEATQEFKSAFQVGETKSTLGNKLSPAVIGAKVLFGSGYVGTYLGAGSCVHYNWYDRDNKYPFEETYFHFFLNDDSKGVTLYRDPKPMLIEPGQLLSDEVALATINEHRDNFTRAGNTYSSYGTTYFEVNRARKLKSIELHARPFAREDALKTIKLEYNVGYGNYVERISTNRRLLLGVKNGRTYWLPMPATAYRPAYYEKRGLALLHEVKIAGRSIVHVGDLLEIELPTRPTTKDLVAKFDGFLEVVPVITY